MKRRPSRRQRGVAVVTALLLAALAITIVTSLFWQQNVQVRSIENQRLQLQKLWILRGALDWAQLIIRTDIPENDNLDETWAVPLADTRLDQYLEKDEVNEDASEASLSGNVIDAQSRFNLTNLIAEGGSDVDLEQLNVFTRLLENLKIDTSLAPKTAELMLSATKSTMGDGDKSVQFIKVSQVEDLLAVKGFTPANIEILKKFVTVLPIKTEININTAPAEVIAARIDKLSLSDAVALVAERKRAYFRDMAGFTSAVSKYNVTAVTGVGVKTKYFIINGNVRMSRASMRVQALVERGEDGRPQLVWIRQQ